MKQALVLVGLFCVLTICPLRAAEPAGATPSPSGDEVMRPTQRGLRVTPTLAVLYSRAVLENIPLSRDLYLSDDQKWQMAGVFAKHGMDCAGADPEGWRQLSEGLFEAEVSDRGRLTPDTAPEFARRCLPMLPSMRQFCENVQRDSKQFLDPIQVKRLDESLQEYRKELDRGEERLRRWSEGKVEKTERPFDNPRRDETPEEKLRRDVERRRYEAMHDAEREMRAIGPDAWGAFLERTVEFYGFDAEQRAAGTRILHEHRDKAKAIMTVDWLTRIQQNRIAASQLDLLAGEPVEPLRHRLMREQESMMQPLKELGSAFRSAVIALATLEQQERTIAQVKAAALEHGMDAEELRYMEALLMGR